MKVGHPWLLAGHSHNKEGRLTCSLDVLLIAASKLKKKMTLLHRLYVHAFVKLRCSRGLPATLDWTYSLD